MNIFVSQGYIHFVIKCLAVCFSVEGSKHLCMLHILFSRFRTIGNFMNATFRMKNIIEDASHLLWRSIFHD